MTDTKFSTQSVAGGDTSVDNELVTTTSGVGLIRQRVRLGGAVGTALADIASSIGSALGHLFVGTAVERVDSTITAVSTLGAANAQGITGAEGTAASTVRLSPAMQHSSWTVQVSGTWVGTIVTEVTAAPDPTSSTAYWIPVNSRQSAGGRLANSFTVSGLFRGALGGVTGIRARATAFTSGTATVAVVAGDDGAVFQNSDIVAQSEAQYFASSAGLNSGWGVSSQEINLSTTSETPLFWIFNNDSTGGRVLYLSKVSKGGNGAVKFRRYRTGPGGTQMTRTSGGTLLTINNRANQAATATAAVAYAGTNLVIANIPTYYEKTVFVGSSGGGAASAAGGQLETDEGGGILIPPQTGLYFTATATVANTLAMIECAYWDGSTLT